ncbi:MAG: ABC transporter ATP-binding protein [Kiritimatiellaeota bacterium]|nr:ABC transporter ATP-binding protein [Kiritimatiellota bacterium]
MKQTPVISLKNVDVCYRRHGLFSRKPKNIFWALEDVSFDVYPGETLGIIGRNGAGKSTLLRLLAGIIAPDRGTIEMNGLKATLLSLQAGFDPFLTGRQNITLSGMLLGMTRKEIAEKEEEIIELADIGDFIDQPVRTYSTGMRVRLGFATAHYVDPDVLLIDEVLGVGDADFQKKSSALIHNKIKSNQTVIIVSHQVRMLENMCSRIITIENRCVKAPPHFHE